MFYFVVTTQTHGTTGRRYQLHSRHALKSNFIDRPKEIICHPRPVSEADFPKMYKATLTYLMMVAVRVCNSDKLNSIDLHFLFDSARPVVLFQLIRCSLSIVLSGSNHQKNALPFIIARQQAGFNALTFEPPIDTNSGIALRRLEIVRTTPFENLLAGEFVTTNNIYHL